MARKLALRVRRLQAPLSVVHIFLLYSKKLTNCSAKLCQILEFYCLESAITFIEIDYMIILE